jgi:glycerol kinase
MLEGICFQSREVLDAMRKDAHLDLEVLRVDGGATVNNLLMQLQVRMPSSGVTCESVHSSAQSLTRHVSAYNCASASGVHPTLVVVTPCGCMQADLLQVPVVRPASQESTSLGAALAAGLTVGMWDSHTIFNSLQGSGVTRFSPAVKPEATARRYARWCKAVSCALHLADLSAEDGYDE